VEPRVGQLEPERVLPVDAGPHGVGRLTVAELLEELEHRHQGQPPRREAGLALAGVQRAEIRVLEEDGELVPQSRHQRVLGKGGFGDPSRLDRDLAYGGRVQAHVRDSQVAP
jgi:hypothetical protein